MTISPYEKNKGVNIMCLTTFLSFRKLPRM